MRPDRDIFLSTLIMREINHKPAHHRFIRSYDGLYRKPSARGHRLVLDPSSFAFSLPSWIRIRLKDHEFHMLVLGTTSIENQLIKRCVPRCDTQRGRPIFTLKSIWFAVLATLLSRGCEPRSALPGAVLPTDAGFASGGTFFTTIFWLGKLLIGT